MNAGQLLVRGSIWPALACGLAAILWNNYARGTRALWLVGLVLYLIHVAAAFGFVHEWSHQQAVEFTRLATVETTGWNSGAGLFFNYAFTLAWLIFVAATLSRRTPLPKGIVSGWQVVFLFMAFNGAVAFARPGARPIGLLLFAGFVGAWCWRHRGWFKARGKSALPTRPSP
jgi:hypothetical protein